MQLPVNLAHLGPSFGRTHRDYVIFLWLTQGTDGWAARGVALTVKDGERWEFSVAGSRQNRQEARDAAMDKATRWIDRWYGMRGQ